MAIKLCIDPGHGYSNRVPGRYDPGAVSAGLSEADIVLQWALTLKWVCASRGVEVFLTRDDDRDVTPVATRDDKAEAAGCTHFISLHCNSGGGTGVEAFYRDAKDKGIARIALDAALWASATGKDRGLKSEGASQHSRLAVFDFDGPCTLVELGFIDSEKDRRWLLNRDCRIAFAEKLLDGLGVAK